MLAVGRLLGASKLWGLSKSSGSDLEDFVTFKFGSWKNAALSLSIYQPKKYRQLFQMEPTFPLMFRGLRIPKMLTWISWEGFVTWTLTAPSVKKCDEKHIVIFHNKKDSLQANPL